MNTEIRIFTDLHTNPRLKYVLEFVFTQVLDGSLTISPLDAFDFQNSNNSIVYTEEKLETRGIGLYNSNWINVSISAIEHPWQRAETYANLTSGSKLFDVSQDIFADIFYHLSRMEEYNAEKDKYGRFSAFSSILHQLDTLQSPLVEQHIFRIKEAFKKRGIILNYKDKFKFIPSYDMDLIWLFKNKTGFQLIKNSVGNIVRGYPKILGDRLRYYLTNTGDPYEVWNWLREIHSDKQQKALFFLLLADEGPIDVGVPYRNEDYYNIVQSLSRWADIGLHPSFASNSNPKLLMAEQKRYYEITGNLPLRSRQHYLKLSFPDTYRNLIMLGIQEDYSMVYADDIGFRAGTCHPFYWYDIENERTTNLKIYPTAFMDVSLKNYLKLKSDEALKKMINIEIEVRKHSGLLICLWHNSSFYENGGWRGWQKMYAEFLSRFK